MRKRTTQSGVPVESRIQSGLTLFFEKIDLAIQQAKEIKSYVYPCFEDEVKESKGHKYTESTHVGYCVPK